MSGEPEGKIVGAETGYMPNYAPEYSKPPPAPKERVAEPPSPEPEPPPPPDPAAPEGA